MFMTTLEIVSAAIIIFALTFFGALEIAKAIAERAV